MYLFEMDNLDSPNSYEDKIEENRRQIPQHTGDLGIPVNPEKRSNVQNKFSHKVIIPQDSYPSINFVGAIIGYKGKTIKAIQYETGAKIQIRGYTVKNDDPLHAKVTAKDPESVQTAVQKISSIIAKKIEENQISVNVSYPINALCSIKNGDGHQRRPTSYEGPNPVFIETPCVDAILSNRRLVAIFLLKTMEIEMLNLANILFIIVTDIFKIKKGEEEKHVCDVVKKFFLTPGAPLPVNVTEGVRQDILEKIEKKRIDKSLFDDARLTIFVEMEEEVQKIGLFDENAIVEYCNKFQVTPYGLSKTIFSFIMEKNVDKLSTIMDCMNIVKEYFHLPSFTL